MDKQLLFVTGIALAVVLPIVIESFAISNEGIREKKISGHRCQQKRIKIERCFESIAC
jgi:hypothetical protein